MEVQPEDWQKYIRPEHADISLHALRYTVTRRLGLYLDQEVEDTNPNGIIGDFGGLADLIGFDSLEIQGFEREIQKGKAVLDQWKNREDLNPTVRRLVEFLIIMRREGILTDMQLLIRADIEHFVNRAEHFNTRQFPVQDETVSSGPGVEEVPRLLTIGEVMSGVQIRYDAFICYNPMGNSSKDLTFVREMISHLESPPYNLKLFVPYRDDLAGLSAHKITTTIISERCRHMVVVLSQNFLESESAEFQSAYAFSLSPCARKRRIIPARLDHCKLPEIMQIMSMCDFTKHGLWDWTWPRLAQSIVQPLLVSNFVQESSGMSEHGPSVLDSGIGSRSFSSNTAPVSPPSRGAAMNRGQCQQNDLGQSSTIPIGLPGDRGSPRLSVRSNQSSPVPGPSRRRSRTGTDTPPRTQSPTNFIQGIADRFKRKKKTESATTQF